MRKTKLVREMGQLVRLLPNIIALLEVKEPISLEKQTRGLIESILPITARFESMFVFLNLASFDTMMSYEIRVRHQTFKMATRSWEQ